MSETRALLTPLVDTLRNFDAYENFLSAEELVILRNLPADMQPWSRNDLNVYYESRYFDSNEMREILSKRGDAYVSHNQFNDNDICQLTRDKDKPELLSLRRAYQTKLSSLHFSTPEESLHSYLILNNLLRVIWVRLTKLSEKLDNANDDQPNEFHIQHRQDQITPLIARVDAINEYIALSFLARIVENRLDNNEEFKAILGAMHIMKIEILPWLALHFRKVLLANPEQENTLVDAFFKFHLLIHPFNLQQGFAKILGGSNIEPMRLALTVENKILQNLRHPDPKTRLQRLSLYILEDTLSDGVCLRVCQDLLEKNYRDEDSSYTYYQFITRIKSDKVVLVDTNAYLQTVKTQLLQTENNDIRQHAPQLYAALVSDTFEELHETASRLNILVPNAKLFYANLDTADEIKQAHIIKDLHKLSPNHLFNFLNIITADNEFFANHEAFLSALGTVNNFPLIALRLHYSGTSLSQNVGALWDKALDQGVFVNSRFFAGAENVKLFSNLEKQYGHFADASKIMAHPRRYRELMIALSIFRTLDAEMSRSLFNGLTINYSKESQWANNFYWGLIRLIANPRSEKPMDFERIVEFLDLQFDKPNVIPLPAGQTQMISAIQHGTVKFYQEHSEFNSEHLIRILSSFALLYKHEKHAINAGKTLSFNIAKLPCITLHLADMIDSGIDFSLPIFATAARKLDLYSVIETQKRARGLLNMGSDMMSMLTNDKKMQELKKQEAASSINFAMQLYFSHCKINYNQLRQDAEFREEYFNFMLFYDMPAEFPSNNIALCDEIDKHLEQSDKNDKLTDFIFKTAPTELQKQKEYKTLLVTNLQHIYSDLFSATALNRLIHDLSEVIQKNTFNKNYLTTDPFHTFLVNVYENCKKLKTWQVSARMYYVTRPEKSHIQIAGGKEEKSEAQETRSNLQSLSLWNRQQRSQNLPSDAHSEWVRRQAFKIVLGVN